MAEMEAPSTGTNPSVSPVAARKELFRALLLCLVAVLLVRSFVFELFKIPSSSMVPTLQIGDHILVSKFNYGFVFPFTSWEFVGWASPKRGDVIVFIYPKDPSLHYIKRVVGVPGDKVEFRGKELWVNGEAVPKEFQGEGLEGDKLLYQEALAGVSHLVQYSKNTAYDFSRSQDVHEVPADHFFVMGDNRDDSYDSRSWGDVPRANIRGKAQFILLSLDRNANWGTKDKMRWSRAFTAIH